VIVGLLGGVASGKSFVAKKLSELVDGTIIDADQVAREVMQDTQIIERIVDAFGATVQTSEGTIDRTALAKFVFGDGLEFDRKREQLNAIVHPEVRKRIRSRIDELKELNPEGWIILDIPLLIENGYQPICDYILFVETPDWLRAEFAAKRGWAADEIAKREASQTSLNDKRNFADAIIHNRGQEAFVVDQLREWLNEVNRR
jgi:dephospho-CoA kinase